ncbi:N-acetylglucosaminylphosphatidylinositol deacetylase, putative [Plasmodium ovale curtisi]|uniref:N-acetylglucosaminylphosphatidylinositol deacetylase n=1 Tax=Plasmodium ovale curtisi TaxID=864141 RepID=A0A1A8W270_PLAOA|nr:N-acetylglucosaminylphosphatidylinositol deacetylase, putative [Plasmodium ovale curtisi]
MNYLFRSANEGFGIIHYLATISTALLVWTLCNFIIYYLNRKKECFFNYIEKYGKEEKNAKNVSLVIAHPDDEVMFFLPTLNLLFRRKKKKEVFLLCLSNGNYYGQGIIRDKEIYDVWSYLGGEKKNCKVVDNPKIQDGWTSWNEELLVNILKDHCSKHNIRKVLLRRTVLTFDSYGISGHPNHRSVYKSARILSRTQGITVACAFFQSYFVIQINAIVQVTVYILPDSFLRLFSVLTGFGRRTAYIPSPRTCLYAYFNSFDVLDATFA